MGIRIVAAALASLWVFAAGAAHAWGALGHEIVSGVGAELLPGEVPAFVRTPLARETIAAYGREPDRWRGAGPTHDNERDAGHFYDGDDTGAAMGVLALNALPETRGEYDTALRASGFDQYKAGYLPYSIVDGWQQLVKDFAIWRVSALGETNAATAADRAWFKADRLRREALTLRDIGIWSHYVGDASQPHHVSLHYDTWGDYPNPENFQTKSGFHARFEGAFVRAYVRREAVLAQVPAFHDCACPIFERARRYLSASSAQVTPLFRLDAKGAFPAPLKTEAGFAPDPAKPPSPEGVAFATARLAAGAGELRDLIVLAWRASAGVKVGWPAISVADVEAGKVPLRPGLYGAD